MSKLKILIVVFILVCIGAMLSLRSHKDKSEVVFWTVQLAPFASYMNTVISEFEQQHPDIKIKWVDVPYSEAEKRVLASLLSNRMPDLINITSDFNMTLAQKGALESLSTNVKAYNPALVNVLSYDNQVWGIPFYATSAVTIYNKSLMKDFGVNTVPKSYDDLFAQMEKAESFSNKYLFMPALTENDTMYKILNKYEISTPQALASPISQSLFEGLANLYKDGKIPREAITQTHREILEKYSSGQIAYLQAGANFLNIINENSPDVYKNSDISTQLYGKKEEYDFSLMTLAVPKFAQHKEEAFLFARFLTNSENQLEFAKLTGILPCNNEALADKYFSVYQEGDLPSKARFIGAQQLQKPITYPIREQHHKEIILVINNLVENLLLNQGNLASAIDSAAEKWSGLLKK